MIPVPADMETIGRPQRQQLQAHHLWDRCVWAKQNLAPVQVDRRVVFSDPVTGEARVLVPDPNWCAMALHGDIVPSIDAYLKLPLLQRYERNGVIREVHCLGMRAAQTKLLMDDDGWKYLGEKVLPGHTLHTATTLPAMTVDEAIDYLVMKDVPPEVWMDRTSNYPKFWIVETHQVPSIRDFRPAWRIAA